MPRQPNPNDIQEAQLRPSMNAPQISAGAASPIGAGGRAIGAAIADVGNAFGQIAARGAAVADAQNDARFELGWLKAQNEVDTEVNQNTGEDGSGYSQYVPKLQKRYDDLNSRFPAGSQKRSSRRELSVAKTLQRRGQYAAKRGLDMRRKYHMGIEDKELVGVYKNITEDPSEDNYRSHLEASRKLIESGVGAHYTRSQADARLREVEGEMFKRRYGRLLKEDPAAARTLMERMTKAKKTPPKDITPAKPGQFKIYGEGRTVPSSGERRALFKSGKGVFINLDTNWSKSGSTSPMIVIPDGSSSAIKAQAKAYVEAIAKHNKEKLGIDMKPRVVTRSQNGRGRAGTIHTEPYAVTDSGAVKYYSSEEGQEAHAEILRQTLGKIPGAQFALPHGGLDGKDKGAHGNGTNEVELAHGVLSRLNRAGAAAQGSPEAPAPQPARGTAAMIPQESLQKMQAIASDSPDAKITDVLTKKQANALREFVPEGVDPEQITVAKALELYKTVEAEGAVADIEKELSGGRSVEAPQLGDPDLTPPADGQSVAISSSKFGEMTFTSSEFKSVNAKQLRQMYTEANRVAKLREAEVGKNIKKFEEHAEKGAMLRPEDTERLKASVQQTGNPELAGRFDRAVRLGDTIREWRARTPAQNEATLNTVKERLREGSTPEQREMLESLEKTVANQKKALQKDSLSYAHNAGIAQLRRLDMNDPKSMQERLQTSQKVAATYGTPQQMFSDTERTAIKDALQAGKMKVLDLSAKWTQGWGQDNAQKAWAEIAGTGSAEALLGSHAVTIGHTAVAKDAEAGLKLLKDKDHKKFKQPVSDVRSAMDGAVGDVMDNNPKTYNAVRALASAAYEERARRNKWEEFDEGEYQNVVNEILGERDIGGVKYGGVTGEMYFNGPGWFDAKQYKVVIPPDVRQDAFDDAMKEVKVADLSSPPLTITGKPLTDDQFQEAALVTKGNGQYYLAKTPGDMDSLYLDSEGMPYVFKFSEVRAKLKKQEPQWFAD